MKLFELETAEQQTPPVVYIDMDGVLADMWGAVAKHHNVSHWRKARKSQRVDQIAKEPGFFAKLKPLADAGKLIHGVVKAVGKYSILSSPLQSRIEQSTAEKTQWLHHHLKSNQPQSVLFDYNKERYARQSNGTPNILIDDFKTNIKLWRARGGIGILYVEGELDRVLQELNAALRGNTHTDVQPTEVSESNTVDDKLYTSKDVLTYINGIHHDYSLDDPVTKHKTWRLKNVPIRALHTPEQYDQEDPYRRLIDLDWDHISGISTKDILSKPVVADANGWLLDGNHRVTAARAKGMKSIPAYVPYIPR